MIHATLDRGLNMSSFLKGLFGTTKDEAGPEPIEVEPVPGAEPTSTFHTLSILDARGVAPEERDRVAKAQQLLRALPQETPAAVKREIVEAALKAFGVSIEDIVSAARHEVDVLTGYIREGEMTIKQLEAQSNQRIAELERQIDAIRQELVKAEQEQESLDLQARKVMDEVEPVLRFFGGAPASAAPPKAPPGPMGPPGPPPRRAVDHDTKEGPKEPPNEDERRAG